jgi:uncharacterized membrane protein YfcA
VTPAEIGLILSIFAAATLYSSVGHAGASGYLAAMALFAVSPDQMKPSALVLNILVSVIASYRFVRAGAVDWKLLLPLAALSVPMAFLGGLWTLPGRFYYFLLAGTLVVGALRLFLAPTASERQLRYPQWWIAAVVGAVIGLLSGLTGVGGGIYLTPVILFAGWASPREASGVSAVFILVNSIAGLAGRWQTVPSLPPELPYWAAAAVAGGLIGSHLGVAKFGSDALRRALAIVLVIAAAKLVLR